MRIKDIKWITDGADVKLPEEVNTNEVTDEEAIADYLSDKYEYLVEKYSVYRGKNYGIREIEAFSEEDTIALSEEHEVIKGHTVYYADLGEFFGYSCLVFKDGHHIYYANDYQLHHRTKNSSELRLYYAERLNRKLFTDEELGEPLSDYDEYTRKEYFLRNYYIMRTNRLSCFVIHESDEDKAAYDIKRAGMVYDPISFTYVEDREFVTKHRALFTKLLKSKERMATDYEYQKKAFLSEMYNHEYGINWQADYDTLSAFGNIRYEDSDNDLESYFTQLEFNNVQKRAYLDARQTYYKCANI